MTATTTNTLTTYRDAVVRRVHGESTSLQAASSHLLAAGGKGVRGRCLHLVAGAFGRSLPAHETLAEAIELVHVGSLIHDDILDGAAVRRGVEAVHVAYGVKVAVLAGDYLMSQASCKVASLGDPVLSTRLAAMIADLCEGELLQDEQQRDLDLTMEAYLDRLAKKTAPPFELACEGAARISGADPRTVAVARRLGFHLGRLFQLVDDMLDWTGEAVAMGKPVGRDLLDGTVTLPVIVALADATAGPLLRAALTPWPETITPALRALVTAPEPARETAWLVSRELNRAHEWLAELPEGEARDELAGMLDALAATAPLGAV